MYGVPYLSWVLDVIHLLPFARAVQAVQAVLSRPVRASQCPPRSKSPWRANVHSGEIHPSIQSLQPSQPGILAQTLPPSPHRVSLHGQPIASSKRARIARLVSLRDIGLGHRYPRSHARVCVAVSDPFYPGVPGQPTRRSTARVGPSNHPYPDVPEAALPSQICAR